MVLKDKNLTHLKNKCQHKYTDDKYTDLKVTDHCHYTGKCRGTAHRICNIKYIMSLKKFLWFFIMDRKEKGEKSSQSLKENLIVSGKILKNENIFQFH